MAYLDELGTWCKMEQVVQENTLINCFKGYVLCVEYCEKNYIIKFCILTPANVAMHTILSTQHTTLITKQIV